MHRFARNKKYATKSDSFFIWQTVNSLCQKVCKIKILLIVSCERVYFLSMIVIKPSPVFDGINS